MSFSGFIGNESERGTTKSREPRSEAVLGRFVCSALLFIPNTLIPKLNNRPKLLRALFE